MVFAQSASLACSFARLLLLNQTTNHFQTLYGNIQTLTLLSSSFVAHNPHQPATASHHHHHHQHRYVWTPILMEMVMVVVAAQYIFLSKCFWEFIQYLYYTNSYDTYVRIYTTATYSTFCFAFFPGNFSIISINTQKDFGILKNEEKESKRKKRIFFWIEFWLMMSNQGRAIKTKEKWYATLQLTWISLESAAFFSAHLVTNNFKAYTIHTHF